MIYIIFFIVIIIGFCFINPKSKFGYFLLMTFMFILFAFNTNNVDYGNYFNKFEYATLGVGLNLNNEIGFDIISKITQLLGGDYYSLHFFIALFGFIIIYYTIKNKVKYKAFIMSSYFLFPFFLDVVQIRFFIITVIFYIAFQFLIKDGFKNDFNFIICILVATSFHYSSILLLPALLIKYVSSLKLLVLLIPLIIIGGVFTFGNLGYYFLLYIMPSEKAAAWLQNRSHLGGLLYSVIHIVEIFYVYYSSKIYLNNNTTQICKSKQKFIQYVLRLNIVLSYIVIFYSYSITFFRIYRVLFLLNYLVFAMTLESFQSKNKKYYLYYISIFLLNFFYFMYMVLPGSSRTIIPILNNNSLF